MKLQAAAQTTLFRGKTPTSQELDDLLLIELAIRAQANLNAERRPIAESHHSETLAVNARALARAEGWRIDSRKVDDSVRRLLKKGHLVADRDPREPSRTGFSISLRASGYARATEIAQTYLNEPLRSFVREDDLFDGMGQTQVEFLGKRYVIGCVEGEEDRAIEYANRFEIDAGEILKAVTGDLDPVRAMLMTGVMAYERIRELEDERLAPASDRLVSLDHNYSAYKETLEAIEQLIVVVRESNSYRETDAADQERRVAELEASHRLLGSSWVSVATLKATLIGTLTYLASKFVDAPIGEAAIRAWTAVKHLLGL